MNAKTFIATTSNGLVRASLGGNGTWSVQPTLADEDVRCLATDPHYADVLYAGTQGNGLLRSSDRGETWQPAGLEGCIVKSVAVSRAQPGLVYAGTKPPRLFVSHDDAKNWLELDSFRQQRRFWWFQPAEWPPTPYIQAIAPSPNDPDVLMVGVELGGIHRSEDGGITWKGHRRGAVLDCHSLTFHPTNGNWVYEAGGSGGGAAYSRDAGLTWVQPRNGLDRHYGWMCAADPAQPDIWYASLSAGSSRATGFAPAAHVDGKANAYIFRSMGGARWEKLGGGLPEPLDYMAYALLTDPTESGHLYAGLSNGDIWHSADYGDTWTQLPVNVKGIHRSLVALW